MDYYIKGLAFYFPLVIFFKNHVMRCRMKKTCSLKVRPYAAHLSDLNEYLASFLGTTLADKMDVTELNEVFFNSMPNSWSKQVYVQGL